MPTRLCTAGAVLGLSLSVAANAAEVAPGATVSLSGTSRVASPWIGDDTGPVLFVVGNVPVRNESGQTVALLTANVRLAATPPFTDRGVLVYRLLSLSSTIRPTSFAIDGFEGVLVDTNWRNDTSGTGNSAVPAVARSADGGTLTYTLGSGTALYVAWPVYVYTLETELENTGTMVITMSTGQTVTLTGLPVPAKAAACEGDSNGDGLINFADLNGVLSNFGEDCP